MSNKTFLFCEYTENAQSLLRSKALFLVYFRSFSDRSSQGFIRSKNYSIIENFYRMIFRMCFLILKLGEGV